MHPDNPAAAATHPDPYPYYRSLQDRPPLLFDPGLGVWIASRAEVIAEVFDHPHCLVRPGAEPVPAAIAGTSAGAVFAQLARMNDGPAHGAARKVLVQALAQVDLKQVASTTVTLAAHARFSNGSELTAWMFALPTMVMARLLGFPDEQLRPVALLVSRFVACLSPLSSDAQLDAASSAADALMARLAEMREMRSGSLIASVEEMAAASGWRSQHAILANLLGLLSQTHQATAGLIGNCIVAMLAEPGLQIDAGMVRAVARRDSPVQNTRRFVDQPTRIAGIDLAAGDVILLLLGASAQAFGHGPHACPGQEIALTIAEASLGKLGPLPAGLRWRYIPSANGRLPEFFDHHEEQR